MEHIKGIIKTISFRGLFILATLLTFSSLFSTPAFALTYTNNMDASIVVGHASFTDNSPNGTGANSQGERYPYGVATDGTHLFVTDQGNSRVLIYNSIPTSDNASADVVIGQPDMNSSDPNVGANTLSYPSFVATDGTHLFVADSGNNRVLIYNHIPTTNNASADVVIGQPDMNSSDYNQGGDAGANTLSYPNGVYYDSSTGKLIVTDQGNNRVLIYNSIPTSDNASADVVIGQPDMNSGGANQDGDAGANTLSYPSNARIIQSKLIIADTGNGRVLIYNSIPTSDNASADVVIGQPDMNSNSYNQGGSVGANTLDNPGDVLWDGSHLLISDSGNNRILIFNSIPTSDNASANGVVGQPDLVSNGSEVTATSLNFPQQIDVFGGTLFVADTGNNRIFMFNNYLNSTIASTVLGQSDFTSSEENGIKIPNSRGLNSPSGVATDGTHLFVVDTDNSRVLIYNSSPTTNNASADVVIGQPDMNSGDYNQNGDVGANTLNNPNFVATDGTHLFVADTQNNRVLIYNHIPTTNNASADVVIGQPDMNSNQYNHGGSVGANTLSYPSGVSYDSSTGKLIITDTDNSRILIYNHIPTSDNAPADVVIGQPDMNSNQQNQGGDVGANTLRDPFNARIIQSKLIIADAENSRVLIYNSIPTSNNASADVVIGQPDMNSNSYNQGGSVGANTLDNPRDVLWDGSHLLVEDVQNNNRILIFNSIPTSDNVSADNVLGQPDFTTNTLRSASANSFNGNVMSQLDFYNGQLFYADSLDNRIMIFGTPSVAQPTTSPSSPSSGGSSNSWSCTSPMPSSAPNLYEADSGVNLANLYFSPAGTPYTEYVISYGLTPSASDYSVKFDLSNSTGAIKYTINALNPNTIYYFKVRAANGCASGDWSNTLEARTVKGGMFYPRAILP